MKLIVKKNTHLKGKITLPSSKSQSLRGLFFSLLAKGESTLFNFLESDDSHDAVVACKNFGITIKTNPDHVQIHSLGLPLQEIKNSIYTGNSGITTHFILPLLGLRKNPEQPIIVDCGNQMKSRPIDPLVKTLQCLGLNIEYIDKAGSLPLRIDGTLRGGTASVTGITSQYLSALLLALPLAEEDSLLTVKNLHERPYVDMTLRWLQEQNVQYLHQYIEQEDIFHIQGGQYYQNFQKKLHGDFSSASIFIAAGVLFNADILLQGLDMNDAQGDKQLISILQSLGADMTVLPTEIMIRGGKKLKGTEIDAKDVPDLLPALAVIGTQMQSKLKIYHVPQARLKETDRIHSMTEGLRRLGANIEEHPDGMTIYPSQLKGTDVNGYGDHRTIMAMTIAGMLAEGITTIKNAEGISKTFPHYVKLMQSLGAPLSVIT